MKATRSLRRNPRGHAGSATRLHRVAVRGGLSGLALGLGLLSTGNGAVLAEGVSGLPDPETTAEPPLTVPGAPDPSTPAPADQSSPAPAAEPAPAQAAPLFPDDDGPAPNVSNISLTGEAFAVRQDVKAPPEALLGRYPRAITEVSRDLTTAFAAYADPGFLGRLATQAGLAAAGDRAVSDPAWAECVFPKSPLTPDVDVRSPGQGAGPTASATCEQGAARAAGSFVRGPGAGSTGGVAVLSAGAAAARVDATSNAAGATATLSSSSLEDVNLADAVTITSITNQVRVLTSGRPGGAVVDTVAVIGGLSISGQPVELPSDSLADLAPVLAQLAPVLTPVGVLTFDVIPEEREVSPDGTQGAGRAAQLLVTLENGESTTSFGLGFASARGRTILSDAAAPGISRPAVPPFRPGVTVGQPLRPAGRSGAKGFVDPSNTGLGGRPGATRPDATSPNAGRGGLTLPDLGAAPPASLPSAGLNLVPPPRAPAQPTGDNTEDFGGDGPWIALIGGSVIALGLARYLAYSTAVRPVSP